MDSALELFVQRGYSNVSLKDVATYAEVHIQTLFRHFPNKTALACAYFDRNIDQLVYLLDNVEPNQDVYRIWKKSALAHLSVANRSDSLELFKLIHRHPELVAHNYYYALRFEDKLTEVLQQQNNRQGIPHMESRLFAAAVSSSYKEAHYLWIRSDGAQNSADILREYLVIVEDKYFV